MAQKRPNLVQNMHFLSFWAKWHFWPISSHARPKNNMNKVPRWVFCYASNKTFDLSSIKRIFCQKMTKFDPKLAFLFIAGSFGALLLGWLVVVARAVSRKTLIYFIGSFPYLVGGRSLGTPKSDYIIHARPLMLCCNGIFSNLLHKVLEIR